MEPWHWIPSWERLSLGFSILETVPSLMTSSMRGSDWMRLAVPVQEYQTLLAPQVPQTQLIVTASNRLVGPRSCLVKRESALRKHQAPVLSCLRDVQSQQLRQFFFISYCNMQLTIKTVFRERKTVNRSSFNLFLGGSRVVERKNTTFMLSECLGFRH